MKKFFILLLMVFGYCHAQTATFTPTPTFTPTFTMTSTLTPINTPVIRMGVMAITTPGAAAHVANLVSVIQQLYNQPNPPSSPTATYIPGTNTPTPTPVLIATGQLPFYEYDPYGQQNPTLRLPTDGEVYVNLVRDSSGFWDLARIVSTNGVTGVGEQGRLQYGDGGPMGGLDTQIDGFNIVMAGSDMSWAFPNGINASSCGPITGVSTPIYDTQVANKAYVDSTTGNFLPLSGGTMSGSITMSSGTSLVAGQITGLNLLQLGSSSSSGTGEVVQQNPADSGLSNFLEWQDYNGYPFMDVYTGSPETGGYQFQFSGQMVCNGGTLGVANEANNGIVNALNTGGLWLNGIGGPTNIPADADIFAPSDFTHGTFAYAVTCSSGRTIKSLKTFADGDAMQVVLFNQNPVGGASITLKANQTPGSGDVGIGFFNFPGGDFVLHPMESVFLFQDLDRSTSGYSLLDGALLNRANGYGPILNVPTPSTPTDAANKQYVDNSCSSSTSNAVATTTPTIGALVSSISSEASARQTAIAVEVQTRVAGDTNAITSAVQTVTPVIGSEASARANSDATEVAARQTADANVLATATVGAYAGFIPRADDLTPVAFGSRSMSASTMGLSGAASVAGILNANGGISGSSATLTGTFNLGGNPPNANYKSWIHTASNLNFGIRSYNSRASILAVSDTDSVWEPVEIDSSYLWFNYATGGPVSAPSFAATGNMSCSSLTASAASTFASLSLPKTTSPCVGSVTLVAGSASVTTTCAVTGSKIFTSMVSANGGAPTFVTASSATSIITFAGAATDTGIYNWWVLNTY